MSDPTPASAQEQMVRLVSRRDYAIPVKLKPAPGDPSKGNNIMIPPRGRSQPIAESRILEVPPNVVMVKV